MLRSLLLFLVLSTGRCLLPHHVQKHRLLRSTALWAGGFGQSKAKSPVESIAKSLNPVSLTNVDFGVQFLGAWAIQDESVCDDLLALFKERNDSGQTLPGMVSMKGGQTATVQKNIKESIEMSLSPTDSSPAWRKYLRALQSSMASYVGSYPMAGAYGTFSLTSRTNLQYYPPGGGYKTYHTERTGKAEPEGSRHLVFMTYLQDVTDAGGTEFLHQNVTVSPRKGLTLIWPADWTITHRGVPSPTQEKAIVTGWFNYS